MKINKILSTPFFSSEEVQKKKTKREFIDLLADNVRNPRDINDCIAAPRGIFKAYILIMAGSSVITIANFLPQKWNKIRAGCNILGATLLGISAVYFAKPFAFKGLSPTVTREEVNANNTYQV